MSITSLGIFRSVLRQAVPPIASTTSTYKTVPCVFPLQQVRGGSTSVPKAKYGGRHTVTMFPGHGIGPEMMGYVKQVYAAVGAPVDFEEVALTSDTDDYGDLHNAIMSVKRNGCAIKANVETKENLPNVRSRNVAMRNDLDLFANVLHCKSVKGVKTRHDDVDIILIRQNTEGEYAMLEHENVPGVVESLKIVTRENTARLFHFAFQHARENHRKKVTIIHKANIMKLTDGLFMKVGEEVAKEYQDIKCENMIVDNCCMQLVSNPWQFDVMVLTNLYGTIVSNLVCGLVGGPGITAGRNYGPNYAMFEPGLRNIGQNLVGKNVANPTAMLRASVDLLRYLELNKEADIVNDGINKTLNFDKIHTKDIGGEYMSTDVVNNVIQYIESQVQ